MIKTHHGTKEQLADLFTNDLGKAQDYHLLNKLGMMNVFSPFSLSGSIEPSDVAIS